jgi:thiamine pyrophosphate-dependent acetolactate synthase large subunit-like protein
MFGPERALRTADFGGKMRSDPNLLWVPSFRSKQLHLTSSGFASPGLYRVWGFATALGAQHARPNVPVRRNSGDGGLLFTATELAAAMRHGIPLTIIVFNDGAYGNVRRIQQKRYGNRLIGSDLRNPDFVALAKSFDAAAACRHAISIVH